jgi:hypothetical protein
MDKAAKEARAEAGQRQRQQEATFAALARGAADPDVRERGEFLQRKQQVDEALASARTRLSAAKAAAWTSGTRMDPAAFRALEEEVRRLGLESQALQTRLGELRRAEKERNREASRAENERFARRFQAAARAVLEPEVYEQLLAVADGEEEEGGEDGAAGDSDGKQ